MYSYKKEKSSRATQQFIFSIREREMQQEAAAAAGPKVLDQPSVFPLEDDIFIKNRKSALSSSSSSSSIDTEHFTRMVETIFHRALLLERMEDPSSIVWTSVTPSSDLDHLLLYTGECPHTGADDYRYFKTIGEINHHHKSLSNIMSVLMKSTASTKSFQKLSYKLYPNCLDAKVLKVISKTPTSVLALKWRAFDFSDTPLMQDYDFCHLEWTGIRNVGGQNIGLCLTESVSIDKLCPLLLRKPYNLRRGILKSAAWIIRPNNNSYKISSTGCFNVSSSYWKTKKMNALEAKALSNFISLVTTTVEQPKKKKSTGVVLFSQSTSSNDNNPDIELTDSQGLLLKAEKTEEPKAPSTNDSNNIKLVCRDNWIPDRVRNRCVVCKHKFMLVFNPRHHCRVCGDVVCASCSGFPIVMRDNEWDSTIRVCSPCALEYSSLCARKEKKKKKEKKPMSTTKSQRDSKQQIVTKTSAKSVIKSGPVVTNSMAKQFIKISEQTNETLQIAKHNTRVVLGEPSAIEELDDDGIAKSAIANNNIFEKSTQDHYRHSAASNTTISHSLEEQERLLQAIKTQASSNRYSNHF